MTFAQLKPGTLFILYKEDERENKWFMKLVPACNDFETFVAVDNYGELVGDYEMKDSTEVIRLRMG